jgi:glycosyltransferase involved in cell wall biosynthesis
MAFNTPGGGEMQLLEYKSHLNDIGVDVTLYDLWQPGLQKCDLVHFFSVIGGSVHYCDFVKNTLNLPLVVSASLWITEETKNLYPFDEIRNQLALADCVIGNSNIECENLSRIFDLPREKFKTIYNGVNEIFYTPIDGDLFRKKFHLDKPFILNVANIEPRKNQLNLAWAMQEFPEYDLVLAGHVREKIYAEKVFTKLPQVKYVGPLDHGSELHRSAYAAAEHFCLPSTLETPGLSALEASACGNQVIITQEGATKEYFGNNAIYVDPFDVGSIAQGIRTAQQRKLNRSQKIVQLLDWGSVAGALKQLYADLLSDDLN